MAIRDEPRITDVRTVLLTGPSTGDPFLAAFKRLRTAAFVEIHTDSRHIGIGETYVGYHLPELVPLVVDYVRPILLGAETLDPPTLLARMSECCSYWARNGVGLAALSAVDAALWDLRGKLQDAPVFRLLGDAAHDRLPAYATGGPSDWPPERLLEKVDFYLAEGFRAVKVSTGYYAHDAGLARSVAEGSPSEIEVEKVSRIRHHVGSDVGILLDGHMGAQIGSESWDMETAAAVLEALEPQDIVLFEEPLPYADPALYAELARGTSIPIAGGEQLASLDEFHAFADGFDIAQPDASWLTMTTFVDVAKLFAERGRGIAPHCWSGGGGLMQNVHAAFASPNSRLIELPPAAGPLHTEVWGDSLRMVDGAVIPPETPGLGVELSDALKKHFPFQPGAEEFVPVRGKQLES